jgi:hypothetical protein
MMRNPYESRNNEFGRAPTSGPGGIFQSINSGLDDFLHTMDRVHSVYGRVQKMTPMFQQVMDSFRQMESFQNMFGQQASVQRNSSRNQKRRRRKRTHRSK